MTSVALIVNLLRGSKLLFPICQQLHRYCLIERILAEDSELSQLRRTLSCRIRQTHSVEGELVCISRKFGNGGTTRAHLRYILRVFLHGKVHADYRKALNVLFTKKALRYEMQRCSKARLQAHFLVR